MFISARVCPIVTGLQKARERRQRRRMFIEKHNTTQHSTPAGVVSHYSSYVSINMPTFRVVKETLIEFFKNLISFFLNLSSHGKSPDPVHDLIYKVNKVLDYWGHSGY
jgi:hypothetical protein